MLSIKMPPINFKRHDLSKLITLSVIGSIAFFSNGLANAASVEEKGLEIAKESKRRDTGWKDSQAKLRMVLKNRRGDKSIREIRSKMLEVINDGDKSLTIFDKPRDVKGTAFLSHTHPTKPDDQWIYLPSLKRVKRISSSNKSGPFMGSEFAFEDLTSFEIERYNYKYLRDETIKDQDCYVIEMYPQYKHSGYVRTMAWIDKEHYRVQQIVFYDRKNSLLKTLNYNDYHQYLNKFWRASSMFMQNHQTGKSTNLEWSNYRFKTGLTDRDFGINDLKRAK